MQAGEGLQFVERVDVEGIAGGDDEGAVLPGQRHEGAAMDELERHRLEGVGVDRDIGQVDEVHAEFLGEDRQDVFFLGEALLDE